MQKPGGIDSAGADQAEVGQGSDNRAVACRDQLIRDAAKAAAIRRESLAGKEGNPFLGHELHPGRGVENVIIAAVLKMAPARSLFKVLCVLSN